LVKDLIFIPMVICDTEPQHEGWNGDVLHLNECKRPHDTKAYSDGNATMHTSLLVLWLRFNIHLK
jgi:hypothetical protein